MRNARQLDGHTKPAAPIALAGTVVISAGTLSGQRRVQFVTSNETDRRGLRLTIARGRADKGHVSTLLQSLNDYPEPHSSDDFQSHPLGRRRVFNQGFLVFRVLAAQH